MQTFRTALQGTRAFFTQTVYTAPSSELIRFHPLVFQTAVTLHTQTRITSQAAKLVNYVRRTHYDRASRTWHDAELQEMAIDLSKQVEDCEKETKVMLLEMSTRFTVQIRFYNDEEESFGEQQFGSGWSLQQGLLLSPEGNRQHNVMERQVDGFTTEFRFEGTI
ncbi:hypothetical protein TWF694_006304 [Orbilia ellipsospora]|uniref:HORMA domain-containing protein n=1 Tax=Orbilia ellipsospora TaxID=2528407 RepID=A0AAV9XJP6_9PEZI